MKYAHNVSAKKRPFLSPFWLLGFVSLLAGSSFNIAALGFGDQVLFSVTSSFSIVLNTIFSFVFLKENIVSSDIFAIFLICVGSTLFLMTAK